MSFAQNSSTWGEKKTESSFEKKTGSTKPSPRKLNTADPRSSAGAQRATTSSKYIRTKEGAAKYDKPKPQSKPAPKPKPAPASPKKKEVQEKKERVLNQKVPTSGTKKKSGGLNGGEGKSTRPKTKAEERLEKKRAIEIKRATKKKAQAERKKKKGIL